MKKVIIYFYLILILYTIELCCTYCFYKNLHKGHKVVEIIDEETLKKENIIIDDYIKDFDLSSQNVKNIKEKIENEIKEINISYEKVNKEINKSFEIKHEKLIKEEKEMKDKLDNEVTKIKLKLEEYLSLSNELIRNYEKINKAIKTLNKDEDNNNIKMLKNLTYVSKISKNQKEMNKITQILMKNIKINFIEENQKEMNKITQILMKNIKLNFIEDKVKYEEYYFNGLSIPKDIIISDIKSNEFKVSWKIDDLNILNIDKNQIKYKIEIRKENEQFKSVYEGNNMNYNIDKLNSDTNYEIRICTLYNYSNSNWSEIKKVKTNKVNIDSTILNESKRCDEFMNKIYDWTEGKNMELLYRGTKDGMSNDVFRNKCNNKGPTITLIKNDKGYIFGGYASID